MWLDEKGAWILNIAHSHQVAITCTQTHKMYNFSMTFIYCQNSLTFHNFMIWQVMLRLEYSDNIFCFKL